MQGVAAGANFKVCTVQPSILDWCSNCEQKYIKKKKNFTSGKCAKVLPAKHYDNSKFASTDAAICLLSERQKRLSNFSSIACTYST